jgi:hypothetical protein
LDEWTVSYRLMVDGSDWRMDWAEEASVHSLGKALFSGHSFDDDRLGTCGGRRLG